MSEEASFFWTQTRKLIKSNNTTQRALSESIGMRPRAVETWINQSIVPDAIQAVRIAAELGTTVEFLVTGSNPSPQRDLSKERAVELARKIIETLQ